ncbi:hypothetical protein C8E00_101267 [Chromohalobacter marismortui]|uniref:Uncharacterized protein n=1 Tax=Chromohalobacter marismortui TaxID=42055 RepID=A0A4R7NUR8_9GAMM|nr:MULTISPECIES: hypothetical protein [Chromohalobacter]MCI0510541.1 hypothetical protein [Chromohalobacter sp.]MCI0594106.1 hypothetical protein [Chromohalobacter sp.]TDU24883.1 hypothetical protein C8E00_101267 [Chromohalobacter marismortui]
MSRHLGDRVVQALHRWRWPGRSRQAEQRLPVILCGLDYAHYRLLTHFAHSTHYSALAVVDDYPWHHGTHVEGVRVYYPSEVPSLVERHGVVAVVYCHADDLAVFGGETRERLAVWGVPCVRLSPNDEDIEAELTSRLASRT